MIVLGAHAIPSTRLDVWIMFIFGIISFISRTLNFHPAPIVLGLIVLCVFLLAAAVYYFTRDLIRQGVIFLNYVLIGRAVFSVLTINRHSPNWSTSPSAIR